MGTLEEPSTSSSSDESRAHTPAYANFDSNTDKLKHLFSFILSGLQGFSDDWKINVAPEIARLRKLPDKEANDQETKRGAHYAEQVLSDPGESAEMAARVKKLSDILEPLNQFTGGLVTIYQWIPVILVTTVEAYLKDVLIFAATMDSAIMESTGQTASYAEVVRARSIEELTAELRSRWARKFVDDGGPERWIERLTKMGAREYRSQAANEMENLWGVRHLIVHSAGVATPDFVYRHPEISPKVFESILIRSDQISAWVDVIYHFVDITDFYFVQRYGPGTVSTT